MYGKCLMLTSFKFITQQMLKLLKIWSNQYFKNMIKKNQS